MALFELTEEKLQSSVSNNDLLIIDFWALWCGPCLRFRAVELQMSTVGLD